nr:LysE family translocator [Acinetobacter sp. Marseille-Q1620]
MISLEYILTSLVIILIPGTGVLYTVTVGLTQGKKASIYAALGCTAGIIPHLLATILGLAAIMHTSALAFQTLKWLGVIYLFYIAIMTWKDKSLLVLDTQNNINNSNKTLILKSFLMNILNPKLTIFFLAFLPQYVPANTVHPLFNLIVLSSIFMLMTFFVFIIYGVLANIFRKFVIESKSIQQILRYSFTAIFVSLGIKLSTTRP